MNPESRELLLHYIATLAYRGRNVLSDLPEDLVGFRPADTVRNLTEILAHVNEVLRFARRQFGDSLPGAQNGDDWRQEADAYFENLNALDQLLAESEPVGPIGDQELLQGPFSDAMLHLGQIGIFRRLGGSPVPGEDYSIARLPGPPWRL